MAAPNSFSRTKGKNITSWIIQILLTGLFLMMGGGKLMSDPEVVANFTRWGMPDNFYLVIGIFEVLGAIGLLIPRLAGPAAIGLILIIIGALFTHVNRGEMGMAVVPLVTMILLGAVAYLRNPLKLIDKQKKVSA